MRRRMHVKRYTKEVGDNAVPDDHRIGEHGGAKVVLNLRSHAYTHNQSRAHARESERERARERARASNGEAGYDDGEGAAARFNDPTDVVVDKQGTILVADLGNESSFPEDRGAEAGVWVGVWVGGGLKRERQDREPQS
jgi:hypothetical protein